VEHLYWIIPAAAIVAFAIAVWLSGRLGKSSIDVNAARRQFQQQQEDLQQLFFHTASASGKPRGLRWKDCQWSDLAAWLRDKQTGELLALVGVTISFEAIEGSDMEGVEAVGNLRNATAVFVFQEGSWGTTGRVVFNLNPDEAAAHFQAGYERLEM